MSDTSQITKKKKDIQSDIQSLELKLKKLKEQARIKAERSKAKNQKAVSDLLKKHKLDIVSIERWNDKIAEIKTLLS